MLRYINDTADNGERITITAILFFIIAFLISPFVARIISRYLTTYTFMILAAVTVFYVMVDKKEYRGAFLCILIFLSIMFMFEWITHTYDFSETMLWGYRFLLFILPLSLGDYLCKDDYLCDRCNYYLWIVLIITSITTIIGSIRYPEASRWLATVDEANNVLKTRYDMANIGGYEFVYTVTLLYPLVVYSWKRKRLPWYLAFTIMSLFFGVALFTEYTTATLLCSVSTITVFVKKTTSVKRVLCILLVILLAFYFIAPLASSLLIWLSNIVDSPIISERLNAIALGSNGIQESEDGAARLRRYQMSIDSFFSSPIWGGAWEKLPTGGHSFILDFLGMYGAIGMFLLLLFYTSAFILFYREWVHREYGICIIWFFLQTVILSLLNAGMWIQVLTLFGPVILHCINHPLNKTKQRSKQEGKYFK